MDIAATLSNLEASGNFRRIPAETDGHIVDLSSNDYLGIAECKKTRDDFFASLPIENMLMSSSASRLLGARQREFDSFENLLSDAYGRDALLFNSGYHANVGLIQAIADKQTLIIADKLVHASIIDGIRLSGAPFERFRHNDYDHLIRIITTKKNLYSNILIIAESVYSMDGDRSDIERLIDIKRSCGSNAMLYIDEAHAVGVLGRGGLGLCADSAHPDEVDIVVGTLGKALASVGAYAILAPRLRDFMVNKARSLIFSTALPPVNIAWSEFVFRRMIDMDDRRKRLASLSSRLAKILGCDEPSHIRPYIIGDPHKALDMSARLLKLGYKVLPIRTPTVPPGTERLRFSLSAALTDADLNGLHSAVLSVTDSIADKK